MNKLDKIAKLEKTLAELKEEIKKEEEISFSKFIGRNGNTVVIKGKEKNLISLENGGLNFLKNNGGFTDKVTATKTTLKELKVNDVFIFESNIEDMEIEDFEVVVGLNNDGDLRTQYIENNGCDYISCVAREIDRVVYKINRF